VETDFRGGVVERIVVTGDRGRDADPEVVILPRGISTDDVADAIALCRKLGLLYDDTVYLLLPSELAESGVLMTGVLARRLDGEPV
jgi:hypothetical protein